MQREDRMTGLPNRRAFEEYMERIRTGEVGCRDAVLTYIRLEGLNERNDRLGLQAGDEAVIARRTVRCRLLPRVRGRRRKRIVLPHRRKRVRPHPSRAKGKFGADAPAVQRDCRAV